MDSKFMNKHGLLITLIISCISITANPLVHLLKSPYSYIAAVTFVLAGITAVIIQYCHTLKLINDVYRGAIHDLLVQARNFICTYQKKSSPSTLRINIMIIKNQQLHILDQVGMSNDADKDIIFNVGQGCCGQCVASGRICVGDLEDSYYETFEESINHNRGQTPWGITKEQWELTQNLKSLVSIPIFDTRYTDKVIAVLNVDDKMSLEESRFRDDELIEYLEGAGEACAKYALKGDRY